MGRSVVARCDARVHGEGASRGSSDAVAEGLALRRDPSGEQGVPRELEHVPAASMDLFDGGGEARGDDVSGLLAGQPRDAHVAHQILAVGPGGG